MLWAKAFKKELYKRYELKNVRIVMGEDGACVRPCIYNSDVIFFLKDFLYVYRINEESATRKIKPLPWNGPDLVSNH